MPASSCPQTRTILVIWESSVSARTLVGHHAVLALIWCCSCLLLIATICNLGRRAAFSSERGPNPMTLLPTAGSRLDWAYQTYFSQEERVGLNLPTTGLVLVSLVGAVFTAIYLCRCARRAARAEWYEFGMRAGKVRPLAGHALWIIFSIWRSGRRFAKDVAQGARRA